MKKRFKTVEVDLETFDIITKLSTFLDTRKKSVMRQAVKMLLISQIDKLKEAKNEAN